MDTGTKAENAEPAVEMHGYEKTRIGFAKKSGKIGPNRTLKRFLGTEP